MRKETCTREQPALVWSLNIRERKMTKMLKKTKKFSSSLTIHKKKTKNEHDEAINLHLFEPFKSSILTGSLQIAAKLLFRDGNTVLLFVLLSPRPTM